MTQDAEFYDGFDKYGPVGRAMGINNLGGEWTSHLISLSNDETITVADSLGAGGQALKLAFQSSHVTNPGHCILYKSLPGAYARIMFSVYLSSDLTGNVGVVFYDSATPQFAITIDHTTGRISAYKGAFSTTAIATSGESVSANAAHCLQGEVVFHNSAGVLKCWLDGQPVAALTLSGIDTNATANASANAIGLLVGNPGLGIGDFQGTFDHLKVWMWSASGGVEAPPLTNPIVDTYFPVEDDAVDFAFGAGVLGSATRVVTTTNAPGANRLSLIRVTAEIDSTLDSISIVPAATSASAKFKGVAYADNGGTPTGGALLSTGTEVIGCTSGVQLDLPLATPPSINAGDAYWIGYITDTSVAIRAKDGLAEGVGAANTYGSGAPGTGPSVTALLTTWLIWGNVSGVAENWPQVNENPPIGDLSYVEGDAAGQQDLFVFEPLRSTPTVIYGIAVKANMRRTDAGARTVNLIHKSGAVQGDGLQPGVTPATTYGWVASYYRADPDTLAAFNESGLNAGLSGYEIAS